MTANLDTLTGNLNKGQGTLGQMVVNRELFDRLNSMSGHLDTVMAGLQKGDGTAGMVLKDKQLYENMNAALVELRGTLQDTRTLLTAIQKDPKRYLNIKVSIF
jgi:phospholipid/cholesterol/gamma-HCH transport system substrate-binding protein